MSFYFLAIVGRQRLHSYGCGFAYSWRVEPILLVTAITMHNYGRVTPQQLADVIAAGESLTVEFKRATQGAINDNAVG